MALRLVVLVIVTVMMMMMMMMVMMVMMAGTETLTFIITLSTVLMVYTAPLRQLSEVVNRNKHTQF